MPFIGNQPALSYTSFAVQHFTTSATTSYTLDYSVANENEIRLVINNVVQQPGSSYAYTASGTTLTLSAATSATDTMYAVFLGKAVQTVTPASGTVTNAMIVDGTIAESKLASGVNTITMVDQWRLTTSITADTDPLTGVFERVDETTYGGIGTGMTESSGDWIFPSTGIYLILVKAGLYADGDSNISLRLYMYDGSTYNLFDETSGGSETGIARNAGFGSAIVDVTNTSTIKAQFRTVSFANTNQILLGDTNYNRTSFTFIRLGDT